MQEQSTDEIQRQSDATNDQHKLGVFNACICQYAIIHQGRTPYKAIDGLKKDADSQRQEENAIEKGTQ
jgi:hypothetical protein